MSQCGSWLMHKFILIIEKHLFNLIVAPLLNWFSSGYCTVPRPYAFSSLFLRFPPFIFQLLDEIMFKGGAIWKQLSWFAFLAEKLIMVTAHGPILRLSYHLIWSIRFVRIAVINGFQNSTAIMSRRKIPFWIKSWTDFFIGMVKFNLIRCLRSVS